MTIRLFCSYSRKDEAFRQALEVHLATLKRQNLVTWHDGLLEPGSDWDERIKQELETAEIIVLLVSPDFLASNYCYETEVERALQRHREKTACVIPVLLRPTDIEGLPLFQLNGYPRGLKPIAQWSNQDEAFVDVVKGIRKAVELMGNAVVPTASGSGAAGSRLPLQGFAFESVTVDATGKVIRHQPGEAQQWVEDLGNGVALEMVNIPGGSFLMGSPRDEEGRYDSESPQHRVAIAPFFMGKYPITQSQYQAVMGSNPSHFQENGAHRPVEEVSWEMAIAFCQKLSQKTRRDYRLPSEAEWEYACRAGTTTPFHFGETITTDLANFQGTDWEYSGTIYSGSYGKAPKGQYREETIPVGQFPPNTFGLFDMHGNVWEWCVDYWHPNYQGAPTDGRAWITGGDSGSRLLRGGSWCSNPLSCRSANRGRNTPDDRDRNFGFRVVLFAART
ncbi:MAG: SUMF1/EgtB/PvdO family nonheme iron enzyme [Oculatellaceae cyanobacterium Prado106]|jgi:formylglycine-generating enzyme required for sulfatase activity|nr:SUMF1/EgtB/PvdO family nonheme iron enzyme [Oculatellaceae cyanobacterium Prado106]